MGGLLDIVSNILSRIIRVGVVSGRVEGTHRVRVTFADTTTDAFTSAELQVLARRAKGDKEYDLPDIDDQVLCLFLPIGCEVGFVLGSMYGAENPQQTSGNVWQRLFADGTIIQYDRGAHKLTATVKGSAELTTEQDIKAIAGTRLIAEAATFISLTAPDIYQNGNVTARSHSGSGTARVTEAAYRTINGSLTINGPSTFNGPVTFTDDVTINADLIVNGNTRTTGNSYAGSRSGGGI